MHKAWPWIQGCSCFSSCDCHRVGAPTFPLALLCFFAIRVQLPRGGSVLFCSSPSKISFGFIFDLRSVQPLFFCSLLPAFETSSVFFGCYLWSLSLLGHYFGHAGRLKRCAFDSWVRKIRWRRAWQTTPAFLPGECHGQRSLEGYSV